MPSFLTLTTVHSPSCLFFSTSLHSTIFYLWSCLMFSRKRLNGPGTFLWKKRGRVELKVLFIRICGNYWPLVICYDFLNIREDVKLFNERMWMDKKYSFTSTGPRCVVEARCSWARGDVIMKGDIQWLIFSWSSHRCNVFLSREGLETSDA